MVSGLYCHVEVLGSVPGQGKNYKKNYGKLRLSGAPLQPMHSAVMSRPGLYLIGGKAAEEGLAIALLIPDLQTEALNTYSKSNGHLADGRTFTLSPLESESRSAAAAINLTSVL